MIHIFNELDKPVWTMTKKNDYFYRISDGKVGIDVSNVGIKKALTKMNSEKNTSLTEDDLFDKSAFDTHIEAEKQFIDKPGKITLDKLCGVNTMVTFDKRNLKPFIRGLYDVRYNNDIFICTFDMSYQAIYSVGVYDGNIYAYNYDTEANTFSIIFSLMNTDEKKSNGGLPSLRIHGVTDSGAVYRKRIIADNQNPGKFIMQYNVWQDKERIPKSSKGMPVVTLTDMRTNDLKDIRLKTFRPKRPCCTIICDEANTDSCKSIMANRYRMDPDNDRCRIYIPRAKRGGIQSLTANLRDKQHIETVTFYTEKYTFSDFKTKMKDIRREFLINNCGNRFNTVQVLTKDGVVNYIK